ncbi:MAG TPA: IclR family transcriptional regulator [Ktedonobacterales bacterium]|jgi:DNA-binding IclR family transcriptional regulator|nr:IclR family transcriptional regulator [Ktedonobacterales bacterium]HEX5570556.1 IclR family transcriptional regulator [Ktedonobacterales bacterium]
MEYTVPSVALAAQALKLLSRHKYKSSSLTEIARKLGASPTTCLRVLRTLEREDFVHYDHETRRYSLGPYLIPLGDRAAELNDAVARATAEIGRIAAQTGMTTALVQRWDDRPVYIAAAQPPTEDARFSRLSISIGQATPLTAGAHGRCFLAYDDESEWQRHIAAGLRPMTPATITDPVRFADILRDVRRQGYAVSDGEFHRGATAVDAPIFGKSGQVEFVISSVCISSQLDERHLAEVVNAVRGAARKLSEWNGYAHHMGDELEPEAAKV